MPVYNDSSNKLVSYLRQLELSTDEVSAYLCLLQSGPQTVLALSRTLKTGRTKLYPLLEELATKQLVIIRERHYGTSYQAASPEALSWLVDKQEQRSSILRSGLPATLHSLKELQQSSPSTSKIVEYHDTDGLKQMRWNLASARTSYFILELPIVSKQIGKHIAEKTKAELSKKQITGYLLTNRKQAPAPARYVDSAIFTIKAETYVYDTTVSLLTHTGTKSYGIEIYNQQLAQQYKQLMSLLLQNAS